MGSTVTASLSSVWGSGAELRAGGVLEVRLTLRRTRPEEPPELAAELARVLLERLGRSISGDDLLAAGPPPSREVPLSMSLISAVSLAAAAFVPPPQQLSSAEPSILSIESAFLVMAS